MTSTTPPPLTAPTSKEKKYDRQLRLWAASGQAALESAHILLINSGPGCAGVETLKNLVLPGIGQFTILDSNVVGEEDLGLNFFLQEDSLGGLRAEQTCHYLKELNEDVQGHFIAKPLESLLVDPSFFSPYSLIIVTAPIAPEALSKIQEHAITTQTPVFYIHSVGFYSEFSLHLPHAFPIVDTHPDPATTEDLRLLKPWPALEGFTQTKTHNLEKLDDHEHGHVPYALILLHHLEKWKADHAGQYPQNYREKSEFRDLVRKSMRTSNPEGGEENFEEAVGAVLKSLNAPTASSAVKEVFAAPECRELTQASASFWIITHAVSQFYTKHGALPLSGAVPDMKAQSKDYIQLQNIYKSKAREDIAEVLASVRELERSLGRGKAVDEKEVEAYCKGAAYVKLVRGRPFHVVRSGETLKWGERARAAVNALTDPTSTILIHIAFLAYDSFYASQATDVQSSSPRPPGLGAGDLEADTTKMIDLANKVIDELISESGEKLESEDVEEVKTRAVDVVKELTRAGGAELHNIAALTGGLVAQEVIKVVTKQYVPVDNICLVDGVKSTVGTFKV